MKTKTLLLIGFAALYLAACAGAPAAPAPTAAPKSYPSSVGNLTFASGKLVKEVNGVKPYENCKLLLVFFNGPDMAHFDLAGFGDLQSKFIIRGEDGSQTTGTMAGLVEKNFAIGFQVPAAVKTYLLVWPDGATTDITAGIQSE